MEKVEGCLMSKTDSVSYPSLSQDLDKIVMDTPNIEIPKPSPKYGGSRGWKLAMRAQLYEFMEEWHSSFGNTRKLTEKEQKRLDYIKNSDTFKRFYLENDPSPELVRKGRLFMAITEVSSKPDVQSIQFNLVDLHTKTLSTFLLEKRINSRDITIRLVGKRHRSIAGSYMPTGGGFTFV
jgi:hypothetical protein